MSDRQFPVGAVNASSLQGIAISPTAPTVLGQLLAYNPATGQYVLQTVINLITTGQGITVNGGTLQIQNSGVSAGNYGDASHTSQITVDIMGRITAATSTAILIDPSTALSASVPPTKGGTGLNSAGGTANRLLATPDGSTFGTVQLSGPYVDPTGTFTSVTVTGGAAAGGITVSGVGANDKILMYGLVYGSSTSVPSADPGFTVGGVNTINQASATNLSAYTYRMVLLRQ